MRRHQVRVTKNGSSELLPIYVKNHKEFSDAVYELIKRDDRLYNSEGGVIETGVGVVMPRSSKGYYRICGVEYRMVKREFYRK